MSAAAQAHAVYLDYAATTPLDPRVAATMRAVLEDPAAFGNPSSDHVFGAAARARITRARAQAATLIGAQAQEIVWTASATEANNLALLGLGRQALRAARLERASTPPHIVTSRIEHKSVINPCKQLEKEGCRITWLQPSADGLISPESVAEALQPQTVLVSIMHVNNELGTVNDVAAIGRLCRARGVPLHVDAVQGAGKVVIDVHNQHIDLLSLGAHKIYGPKGIGALYVRSTPPLPLDPLIFGGGQEGGLRSGTSATHQIAGMGLACALAAAEAADDAARLAPLRARLRSGLEAIGGVLFNPAAAAPGTQVPHILNASFEGVHGESLQARLQGLAVSSGSTCNSASGESSYVLRALGRSDALAEASLRFSLGRFTTAEDIEAAVDWVRRAVLALRAVSPAQLPPPEVSGWAAGEAGSIKQGTWVRVLAQMEGGRITAARCQVYGCPHTLAAGQWLEQRLPGRGVDAAPISAAELAAAVNAPPQKLGRLLIVEDALVKLTQAWR